MVQLLPGARVFGQEFVSVNWLGLPPEMTLICTLSKEMGVIPRLLTVTFWLVLAFRYSVPKLMLDGATLSAELKFAFTLCGAFMAMVVEALLTFATPPAQLEKT